MDRGGLPAPLPRGRPMSSMSSTSSTPLVPSVPAAVPASAAHDMSARRLALAMTALVVTDAVGGVLAVVTGVNSWAEAWGPAALLAAPAPMVAGQVLLVVVAAGAIRRIDARWAAVAAVVLALACLVSVASGFVDGG